MVPESPADQPHMSHDRGAAEPAAPEAVHSEAVPPEAVPSETLLPESTPAQAVTAPLKLDRLWAQWPLLLCLAFFAAGMIVTATSHWRRGAVLMGAGLGLAGVLRLFRPPRIAGLLVVRRRWFDVALGILGGGAMCLLAILVPPLQR